MLAHEDTESRRFRSPLPDDIRMTVGAVRKNGAPRTFAVAVSSTYGRRHGCVHTLRDQNFIGFVSGRPDHVRERGAR